MKSSIFSIQDMLLQYPTLMYGLSHFLIFVLIQGVSASFEKVTGFIGHNITLPCLYNAQTYGVLRVCWGQDWVPMSKCSNTILSSKGEAVLFRQSPKYQLLGRVMEGDVSMTIVNAQRTDAGVYGCRVEIPGLLNDIKINIRLTMEEEPEERSVNQKNLVLFGSTREAFGSTNLQINETKVEKIISGTHQKKGWTHLDLCNIGKMSAIIFLPVILILAVLIRRRIPLTENCSRTSVQSENIYESIPMTT
ncbi:uncharacterized protein LOC112153076 [Oryzias melastigma]|uniref:uncharacterized protein LOC112153076 n=1 Tax=Oryzias melastigma TaxID=30732 RepID=UPI000CF82F92|nr:uncharacterized protein LOC112153076 [Oryzias melastigma]